MVSHNDLNYCRYSHQCDFDHVEAGMEAGRFGRSLDGF